MAESNSDIGMPPVHPGKFLAEQLRETGMSATAFAAALGVPTNRVTAILNGQRGVTADTALRLSRFFGMPAQYWMNLQQTFELRTAELNSGEAIDRAVRSKGTEKVSSSGIRKDPAVDSIRAPCSDHRNSSVRSKIPIPQDELAALCKANGIRKLSIFGSALRDDFNSESDVDFLAEFEPGQVPSLLGIAGIEIDLSNLLGGRKADLRTPEELSRYFRDKVVSEAETQYERG